jgi:hypothetical protein
MLKFSQKMQHAVIIVLLTLRISFSIRILHFVVYILKLLLLTIHHYFIILSVKTSEIQYNQSKILNYVFVTDVCYSLQLTSARSCNYSCMSS